MGWAEHKLAIDNHKLKIWFKPRQRRPAEEENNEEETGKNEEKEDPEEEVPDLPEEMPDLPSDGIDYEKERKERINAAWWQDVLLASVLVVPATAILSWIGFRNWRKSKKIGWWEFWKPQRWGYSSWGWASLER